MPRSAAPYLPAADDCDFDVLVVGASFLGLELLRRLRRSPWARALRIGVVDRSEREPYLPLIHELLSERLTPTEGMIDRAGYVRSVGADWIPAEVVGFDPDTQILRLAGQAARRGRCVVFGLGSESRPPELPGGEHLAGLKFASQLDPLSERLAALRAREGRQTVAVIGGGITGVELAGELAWLARQRPGRGELRISLVHAGPRLLPGLAAGAGRRALRALGAQAVETLLEHRLVGVELGAPSQTAARALALRGPGGELVERQVDLALWAGGVRPAAVLGALGLPRTDRGWLEVGPTLQCWPQPKDGKLGIFAGGDAARIVGGRGEWPTMQRAIECLWQARTLAENLGRLLHADPRADEAPPLTPHRTWFDFPHGVSVGARSLIVYGPAVVDRPALNTWFRRFLMRRYQARYRPR